MQVFPWYFKYPCVIQLLGKLLSSMCLCRCMGFMALITAVVLCARSQNLLLSVSMRRAHVGFSTAGLTGGGKPCPKTHETTALRRDIRKASCTQLGSKPSPRASSRLYQLSYPSAQKYDLALNLPCPKSQVQLIRALIRLSPQDDSPVFVTNLFQREKSII